MRHSGLNKTARSSYRSHFPSLDVKRCRFDINASGRHTAFHMRTWTRFNISVFPDIGVPIINMICSCDRLNVMLGIYILIRRHLYQNGRDLQTFIISWMKIIVFWSKFHGSLYRKGPTDRVSIASNVMDWFTDAYDIICVSRPRWIKWKLRPIRLNLVNPVDMVLWLITEIFTQVAHKHALATWLGFSMYFLILTVSLRT